MSCHKHCNPVTLVDGAESCSWSPEWMAECLARDVLKIVSKYERQQWLEAYERRHGAESAAALKSLIMKVWRVKHGKA